MRTFYFISFLFFLQTPAYAETYNWVDEHGQKHFTDYPPPEKPPKDSDKPKDSLEPNDKPSLPLSEGLSEQDKKELNEFGEAMGKALESLGEAMGEAIGKALTKGMEPLITHEIPKGSTRDDSATCKKIAAAYIEENNSNNQSKWNKRLHPKVRACIPGQRAYFDSYFSNNKMIPSDYKVTCEKRNPADPLPFEELLAQKMTYPARPNYRIILDYKTGPSAFKTDMVEIFEDQGKWHILLPCLTEAGLKEFNERKQ